MDSIMDEMCDARIALGHASDTLTNTSSGGSITDREKVYCQGAIGEIKAVVARIDTVLAGVVTE